MAFRDPYSANTSAGLTRTALRTDPSAATSATPPRISTETTHVTGSPGDTE
jgi:hypothetical protein